MAVTVVVVFMVVSGGMATVVRIVGFVVMDLVYRTVFLAVCRLGRVENPCGHGG